MTFSVDADLASVDYVETGEAAEITEDLLRHLLSVMETI